MLGRERRYPPECRRRSTAANRPEADAQGKMHEVVQGVPVSCYEAGKSFAIVLCVRHECPWANRSKSRRHSDAAGRHAEDGCTASVRSQGGCHSVCWGTWWTPHISQRIVRLGRRKLSRTVTSTLCRQGAVSGRGRCTVRPPK